MQHGCCDEVAWQAVARFARGRGTAETSPLRADAAQLHRVDGCLLLPLEVAALMPDRDLLVPSSSHWSLH